MPELPEVETVCRGLAPVMVGAVIERVILNRPDLRFPFPERFADRLTGATILSMTRRAKYILALMSTGETLVMHLGMTGRFSIDEAGTPGVWHRETGAGLHEHVVFLLRREGRPGIVRYADPRRFGYMSIVPPGGVDSTPPFAEMGPEPLSPAFTGPLLRSRLSGRRTPLKAALLDQRVVAGLGNIYVCEALYRSRLSPRRLAGSVGPVRAERLAAAIRDVLGEAIEAGGSTLRDYAGADGAMGYFQHRFDVYDCEGADCPSCGNALERIVQSGRSTFFCGHCQR